MEKEAEMKKRGKKEGEEDKEADQQDIYGPER